MLRNQVTSLLEHGRITTTVTRAKERNTKNGRSYDYPLAKEIHFTQEDKRQHTS